jgi:hypothetical protein
VTILTGLVWLFVIVAAMTLGSVAPGRGGAGALVGNRLSFAIVALVLAPGLIAVQVLAQNAFAVLFPAWVTIGPARGQAGIEAMGQRMVLMLASLLALTVLLLPAAIVMIATGAVASLVLHHVPIVVLAILGGITLLAECFVFSEILGAVLDRTDVSAVEVTE